MERERFSSRMGFLLTSVGCAIGLGNIWRFPYITGQYGGAAFVVIYLFFLVFMGLPIVTMELAIGRASRRSVARALNTLEPPGSHWHKFRYLGMAGNYVFQMFYTMITAWMLIYTVKMAAGQLRGLDTAALEGAFDDMVENPLLLGGVTVAVVAAGFLICLNGLRKGVEKYSKYMLGGLFVLLVVLAVHSLTLPGRAEGLRFYLYPDFSKLRGERFFEAVGAAMGQAFYTLGMGIGSMLTFGSYMSRDRSLTSEALGVVSLDTLAALLAGLVIFPACFTYGISADSGPNLVLVTLPSVFNAMAGGRVWGTLFFVALGCAAISTVISAFESIVTCVMDLTGCTRKKAVLVNMAAMIPLSLPAVLGFSVWSGFQPFGPGTNVMDLQDFLVTNNLLPLGGLVYLLFCVSRWGWGWKNFLAEANTGKGVRFPKAARMPLAIGLSAVILVLFVSGYVTWFA